MYCIPVSESDEVSSSEEENIAPSEESDKEEDIVDVGESTLKRKGFASSDDEMSRDVDVGRMTPTGNARKKAKYSLSSDDEISRDVDIEHDTKRSV